MLSEQNELDEIRIRPRVDSNYQVIVSYANHIKRDNEILMTETKEIEFNLDSKPDYLDENFNQLVESLIEKFKV